MAKSRKPVRFFTMKGEEVEEPKPDGSIADKEFPQTGLKITYFAITLMLVVMAYSFIKYRKQ